MRVIGVFCLLFLCTAGHAGGMEAVIAPPVAAQSGRTAEFSVYLHNTGVEAVSVRLPGRLSCRIESARKTVDLSATALPPFQQKSVVLVEGGFVKGRYRFTLPDGLEGPVRMSVSDFEKTDVMFAVAAAAPSDLPAAAAGDLHSQEEDVALESLFTLYQPYLVNFSGYGPMYFLVGTEPKKSKFQISFKYRLLNPAGGLVTEHPWLEGIHLGYTQTSFWDLKSESAPFEDTSYRPELFFVSPNIAARPAWMKGLFIQSGFQHESNGRGGPESRSTNFLYVKPIAIFYDPTTRYGLQIAPKIWAYAGNDDKTNPDLKDYRGYFELDIKFGMADRFVLGSYLRWGREGASIQLDLTYPIRPLLGQNVDLYFQVQYENALAESLLHFQERTEALRLGFSIVR
jgi:outer membrane phospholipase A